MKPVRLKESGTYMNRSVGAGQVVLMSPDVADILISRGAADPVPDDEIRPAYRHLAGIEVAAFIPAEKFHRQSMPFETR